MWYLLAACASFLASLGHISFKLFAVKRVAAFSGRLPHRELVLGSTFFGAGIVLGIYVLRFIDFSVFYSFTALNYLFISVLSKLILREQVDRLKIGGSVVIVIGILIYNLPGL